MPQTYNSPGVYRQEIFVKTPPVLQTGVPGFVGFAGAPDAGGLGGAGVIFNQPVMLNRKEEFGVYLSSVPGSYLEAAVTGFFENGGMRCYVVPADTTADPVQALRNAIAALAPLEDLDLVAVPDASTLRDFEKLLDHQAIAQVQAEVLRHCAEQGNRFAILDSLPAASVDDVMSQCQQLVMGQQQPVNGALYYP